MKKIKVFIIEDSILMQKVITDILSTDKDIEVVGTSKYGKDALGLIPKLSPDIVTLDVNLPDISGLLVLQEITKRSLSRVIMLSAYTQQGAETTIKALEMGALDFIPKPSGETSLDLYNFKDEIISKVRALVDVDLKNNLIGEKIVDRRQTAAEKIVVIGASTGGPKAIIDIMSKIPAQTDAAFLIVQHMPSGFTKSFSERINWYAGIRIKEAEDGDLLAAGCGYVARSGQHLIIDKADGAGGYCLRLDDTALVNYVRPAIDVTMRSVAETFKGKIALGVILTGMGRDGLIGAEKMRQAGAKIIAQDKDSCVVYGMPKAVVSANLADDIISLAEIPGKIMEYLNG